MADVEGKNSRKRYIAKRTALINKGIPKDVATRIARSYAGGKHKPNKKYETKADLAEEIRQQLDEQQLDIFFSAFKSTWVDSKDETKAIAAGWEAVKGKVKASEQRFSNLVLLDEFFDFEDIPSYVEAEPMTSEVQILRVGTWNHPTLGKLDITEDTLQELADHFHQGVRGVDLAVDQAHKPDEGAAGWFKDVIKRDTSLWAKISWTPLGYRLLSDKIYRYFSAEFQRDYVDDETGLKLGNVLMGGALTNRPFVKWMQPVLLSESVLDQIARPEVPVGKAKEGKKPMAIVNLSEAVRTALGVEGDIDHEEIDAALSEYIALADVGTAQLAEDNKKLKGENAQLSERVGKLETDAKEARWNLVRDAKIREGRLTAVLAEKIQPLFMLDEQKANDILDALPVKIDLSERGTSSEGSQGKQSNPDATAADRLHEAVQAKMAEKGISYSAALSEVRASNPELMAEYKQQNYKGVRI